MKKYLCLLFCVLLCFLSACSSADNFAVDLCKQSNRKEIIDSGECYRIYKGKLNTEYYEIYNSDGEIVFFEETNRPLSIDMLNSSIVDISVGMGTGITQHTYYNAEQDIFSDDFTYVLCSKDNMIAYVGISMEDSSNNRTLIVQNIFSKDDFYKEFTDVFSKTNRFDLSSVDGEFSDDFSELIVYYSDDSEVPISKTFQL